MITTFEIIRDESGRPREIAISSGEHFSDVVDFYGWLYDADIIIHGEDGGDIAIMLKALNLPYKGKKNDSRILRFSVNHSQVISTDAWKLNIKADVESCERIEGMMNAFRIHGGILPATPATATAIQFSSKTRRLKTDSLLLGEILACSTTFGGISGETFTPAYRGGLLANPAEVGKLYDGIASFDITSAYPAAIMAYNLPAGPSVERDPKELAHIENGLIGGDNSIGYIGIFRAVGAHRKSWVRLPCIQDDGFNKDCEFDRIGLVAGDVQFGATPPEMALFQMQYDYVSLEIIKIYTHRVGPLPKVVRKFAAEIFRKKMVAEGEERAAAKLAINSIIGTWGRDPLKDSGNLKVVDVVSAEKSLMKYNGVIDDEGEWVKKPSSLNLRRTWDYRWSVYVNSYVRFFLGETERRLAEAGATVLYSDTDSIKAEGDYSIIADVFEKRNSEFLELVKNYDLPRDRELFTEHHLGSFIDESDDYKSAIFFTKRGYVRAGDDGVIVPIVSGANKNATSEQLAETTMERIAEDGGVVLWTPYRKIFKTTAMNAPACAIRARGVFTLGNPTEKESE